LHLCVCIYVLCMYDAYHIHINSINNIGNHSNTMGGN